ncbi:uncharacterized protein LOC103704009 [Phoenix dactylifera]|uniref:Uncharacterized protein LOC103704009 n=1 Tax=Phoenix dactylifera TaxID=42345 RepID=A0A8B8J2Q8_PHODC|nr:uncharacterized protein LOC103704009 [Phoenix dactylifera]XP_026659201.2 uncharacterized protein LOC103704009 [Phoenix dactylifera]
MDAFFNGLDCRLRVSGMVADSIMMGIVNSAMENAYNKSLSKEGDLERLNEKSRFCELAIMQLEWCLKYLQDEIHGNIIEGTREREQLLSDLLTTRDRIHYRLEETEFAIAEKDKELTRSKESESKLRSALEMKGEEVSSLHTALGLERVKTEKASGFVQFDAISMEKNEDHVFGELKGSLHRQLQKIRGKLEDGREILTNLMQKKRRNSSDVDKLTFNFEFGVNGGGMKSLHELYDIAQLKLDFKEIVVDVGILTEKIESSFEMMGRSVSLLKAALDEQQWVSDVEKETSNFFIKSYLQETQHAGKFEFGVPAKSSPPALLDMNWSAIMDDITSLHHELEVLLSQIDVQSKSDGSMDMRTHYNPLSRANAGGKDSCNFGGSRRDDAVSGAVEIHEDFNDTSSKDGKASKSEDLSKENPSGHFVADLIRNHESIIWKKSQEINWLKGEMSIEKGCSLRNDKTFDSVRQIFVRVISRLDDIRRENAKLVAACDNHRFIAYERPKSILQNNSSIYESADKEIMVTRISREFLDKPRNGLCCHLGDTELFEEIRQLEEGNVDLDTKGKMSEEKYTILSKGLMRGIHLQFFDYNIETLIREDVYRVILSGMIKEWNNDIESYSIERLLKKETECIVFSEVIKDMVRVENLTLTKCPDGEIPFGNNLSQTSMFSETMETMQEVESLSNDFKLKEGLDFNCNSEPEESYIINRLLKEEIGCIVFSEVIKDMICVENLALMKCPEGDLPFGKKLSETSAISDSMENMQEVESLSNDFKLKEGFDFNCNSELVEPHIHLDLDGYKIEVSNALNLQHTGLLVEKDNAFEPVDRKFELHHFISSRMHLSKSVPCLLPLDNRDLAHDQVTSASGMIQNGNNTTCSPTGFTGKNWTELQFIVMPLTKFSQVILDFEFMVFDKIKVNISRLECLNSLLNPLIEQVVSIKRKELLYS